jgi:uncharacterized cupin superfamily protein
MSAPKLRLPALDPATVPAVAKTSYPEAYRKHVAGRTKRRLGDAVGLTDFGVNLTELAPGAWSALRHSHAREDEFVYVLDGEVVLITDEGEQTLGPGMVAGFPKGKTDAHHLINKSAKPARYLEIGTRDEQDTVIYPEADLEVRPGGVFVRKDGTPY